MCWNRAANASDTGRLDQLQARTKFHINRTVFQIERVLKIVFLSTVLGHLFYSRLRKETKKKSKKIYPPMRVPR